MSPTKRISLLAFDVSNPVSPTLASACNTRLKL